MSIQTNISTIMYMSDVTQQETLSMSELCCFVVRMNITFE